MHVDVDNPRAPRPLGLHRLERSLVHSANTDLLGAITSGHALLTQLDGQWWMTT